MAIIEEIVEEVIVNKTTLNNSEPIISPNKKKDIKNTSQPSSAKNEQVKETATQSNESLLTRVTEIDQEFFYDAAMDSQELLDKASKLKELGNVSFGKGDYQQAITYYKDAQLLCPEEQQQSIYACNMAACYLKLDQPKEAKICCDTALSLNPLYTKAKLRRAQANQAIVPRTSATLSDAIKDYQDLIDNHHHELDKQTLKKYHHIIKELNPIMQQLMEKEKEEMLGKLKDLGNTLLGKFGLSTDNFQFQKNPQSGNYSVNFVNNPSTSNAN
ncbi:unnamed protein product [Cunninghamella blakesleeana]